VRRKWKKPLYSGFFFDHWRGRLSK
jgi:hypothetical protein